MPTSFTLLADDVWRCILPYLSLSAIHHLTDLDTHLHRTLTREPFALLVLAECCHVQPAQLDTPLKAGRSIVSVMRRMLSGAQRVEVMLGGCGLGRLHQAMLMHSLLCGMQYSDDSSHSRAASSSSLSLCPSIFSASMSDSPAHARYLSTSSEPFSECVSMAPTTASTAPHTPTSTADQSHDQLTAASTPPATTSSSTSFIDSSHLSLLYFYDPPDYPLPSPLRILAASTSPAAHFPFPHAYFALWLTSRWNDRQWVVEWVAARMKEESSQHVKRRRRREMEKQYSSDTAVEQSEADKTAAEEKDAAANDQQQQQQQEEEEEEEVEWTVERHERVAAATLVDLNRCVRWLGEFASPTHPHGEVFGYLTAPFVRRHGRTRTPASREYEYAYIEDGSADETCGMGGAVDRLPVVSWRVVSAPSRMRFALTVWPCLYVYMKCMCAPLLIDGWAKRMDVEKPPTSELCIRGRMFVHMAAMDRWEAMT